MLILKSQIKCISNTKKEEMDPVWINDHAFFIK
jgi:hypothetical protein